MSREDRLPAPPTETFEQLRAIVGDLRRECPWDRKQTHQTLAPHIIEEAYEAKEAIDQEDDPATVGELGDLLLHVMMHAEIASERGAFDLDDIITHLATKLVDRHPHVYENDAGDSETGKVTPESVAQNWEERKMAEGRDSIFDGMPRSLPALQRAGRVQQKAAAVGFDWPEVSGVWEKIAEEIDEFRTELERLQGRDGDRVASEFGDLLFSLVNLSRFVEVDPESALQGTTNRFISRFRTIESVTREAGRSLRDLSLDELEALWQAAKANG